jgi:hypothetical protein
VIVSKHRISLALSLVLLLLFSNCFLSYTIVCLFVCVVIWCVESDPYVEFVAVFKTFNTLSSSKSSCKASPCCIPVFQYNMHFNYIVYLLIA